MDKFQPRKWINERSAVRLISLLTFLAGLLNMFSAIDPGAVERLEQIRPIVSVSVRYGSRMTAALAGFFLLLLASALWRRKRVAWFLALVILFVSSAAHLLKGPDLRAALFSLAVAALLLLFRRSFHAASDRPSIFQGLRVLLAALGFSLVYGSAGFLLLDRHFKTPFNLAQALRQTVIMFTTLSNPGLEIVTGYGKYFADSIYFIGFATLTFAALMLIRPVILRAPLNRANQEKAQGLIQQYGRTALARACLFDDKSYFFYADKVVISYAVADRCAVVLGDPIGDPSQIEGCIRAFQTFCSDHDWLPVFLSVLPDWLDTYHVAGFTSLCIGYEAIVDLKPVTLEGSQNKNLRNAVNHLTRNGYRVEVIAPPVDAKLLATLQPISDAWLALHKTGELYFANGKFDPEYLRESHIAVVYDAQGQPSAFANQIHCYQKNERTLDLMRHLPDGPHGLMEFLFFQILVWARDQGAETFSLGLSAISGVGEHPEDPWQERALHRLATALKPFFNFKGLHEFKERFHPRWEPRYLVYPDLAHLPAVTSAIIDVHTGRPWWKELIAPLWRGLRGRLPALARKQLQ